MKPRSQRLRDDARCYGTWSVIFAFGAILFGSIGYALKGAEFVEAGVALYLATILLIIATVAMLIDMLKARREAECEEYWESKRYYDKFETSHRI